jgi:hypothetical protein
MHRRHIAVPPRSRSLWYEALLPVRATAIPVGCYSTTGMIEVSRNKGKHSVECGDFVTSTSNRGWGAENTVFKTVAGRSHSDPGRVLALRWRGVAA